MNKVQIMSVSADRINTTKFIYIKNKNKKTNQNIQTFIL